MSARPRFKLQPRSAFRFQPVTHGKRTFAAATISRLTADWVAGSLSADSEMRGAFAVIRNRARQGERDNPYVERYLSQREVNIVGHSGFTMQSRVEEPDGSPDDGANRKIEAAFREFSKARNFSADGRLDRPAFERLVARTWGRDGEGFIRIVRGANNPFRLAFQLLESDFVDHTYERPRSNGQNEIRMGVELDEWEKPVAYHMFEHHPGGLTSGSVQRRIRVPADEIIHVFTRVRPGQTRGYSKLAPALLTLQNIDKYEEAELTAARLEACKMGFIETPYIEGKKYEGDDEDESGNQISDYAPGMIEELPYGKTFKEVDPKHPNGNHAGFVKSQLRRVASGLHTGYNSLANDLEGVNYSSLRSGFLDERENWMTEQEEMDAQFCQRVGELFIEMALLNGQINLPAAKLSKFNRIEFIGRRWPWVDPLKDMQAKKLAMELRLESRKSVAAEAGNDIEDIDKDIEADPNHPKPSAPAAKASAPPADDPAAAAD